MRYLYPGDLIWTTLDGDPPPVALAPFAPFSFWTQETGGDKVTDWKTRDGAGDPTINEGGDLLADSLGKVPHLRGPDGMKVPLWRDTGTDQRQPVYPYEAIADVLGGSLTFDDPHDWGAPQNFEQGIVVPDDSLPQGKVAGLSSSLSAAAAANAAAQAAAAAAATAASAAQAAQAQVAALIAGGGPGGLDIAALETRLGGSVGATSGLIPKLPIVRKKTAGAWPALVRVGGALDLAIGPAPGPTDQDADGDVWLEVAL